MARKSPPSTDDDGEVPHLTDEDLAEFRPAREVMPPKFFETVKRLQGERGLGKKPAKVHVSLRIAAGTLEAFKAEGPGWQQRIGAVLDRAAKHKRAG